MCRAPRWMATALTLLHWTHARILGPYTTQTPYPVEASQSMHVYLWRWLLWLLSWRRRCMHCFDFRVTLQHRYNKKQSRCAANAARDSLLVELHLQGLLSHAMCTSNAGPLGTDRLSSFLLLGASGVPATRLHGLTSRLLRSKPTKHSDAGTQSRHSGLLFEQQWHAAQPVVGTVDGNSLENRAHVRRLRLSIRVRSRMGLTSVLLQSRAGKEAALVCAAVLQKVQAGSLNPAWVTRAAQLAGAFVRLEFHCT